MKTYVIKRYLIEKYQISAKSKDEALSILKSGNFDNPFSISIIKETIKPSK